MNNRPHLLQVLRSLVVGTLQEEGLRLGRGSSHSVVEIELEHMNHELDNLLCVVSKVFLQLPAHSEKYNFHL